MLANFVKRRFGRAQAIGEPSPSIAELVRKNAKQVEIAARALRIDGAVRHLHFAGRVGQRAVFFVSGGGGQHDVGALRRFGQEHIVHDEQIEAGEPVGRGDAKVFSGFAPTT